MNTTVAMPLRKKLPLYCLAKDETGKPIHLDCPLTEAEGSVCTAHALAARDKEPLDQLIARRKGLAPIWPTAEAA